MIKSRREVLSSRRKAPGARALLAELRAVDNEVFWLYGLPSETAAAREPAWKDVAERCAIPLNPLLRQEATQLPLFKKQESKSPFIATPQRH